MKIRFVMLSFIIGLLFILGGCSNNIEPKVFFETNGGSEMRPILVSQIEEKTNITPTKDGYVFNNWTFENNDIATLETLKHLTASARIYANWTIVEYQLNYLNLMGSTHTNPAKYTIEDENIILNSPSPITGYTFKGWSKDVPSTDYVTMIETKDLGSIDLYANYELNHYSITYMDPFDQPHPNPLSYTMDVPTIDLKQPIPKTHYQFLGWSLTKDSTNYVQTINTSELIEITLYANYKPIDYHINYHDEFSQSQFDQRVINVETIPFSLIDPNPIKGYQFLGWSVDEKSNYYVTEIDSTLLRSLDLFANYKLIDYTVTYVDEFSQKHTNPNHFNVESFPLTLTAPDNLENYQFMGWSLSKYERLFIEEINNDFDTDITLYAVWESLIDITPPEISGLNPIEHIIGSAHPELLNGVYGSDNLDGEVFVMVDDSKVDYEKVGTYTIYYSAEDKAGNITNKTRTITVIEALSGYYQSATGLSGNSLKLQLRTIINTGFSGVNYGEARYALAVTDRDPNNPKNLIDFYSGNSLIAAWDEGITWNREHVWPQSLLGVDASNGVVNAASDLHNLTPSNPTTNNSRGNKYFDISNTSNAYFPQRAAVRGDIARILLYMEVMYAKYTLVNTTPKTNEMGKLSTLLKWHKEDPVDDFERNRNEVIFNYQGNKNPYIDHPEFVEMIYGVIVLDNDSNQVYFYEILYIDPEFYRKSKYLT
ncbi:MAG: endonuclease [Acholeplasmataceae bacterium]|nr:endonuclease [Acholeplasmataceae bacterium]